jgi:hypothetical protein
MAIVTNVVASAMGGLVRAELDWNNSNGSISKFRVINNTAEPAYMYANLNPPVNGFSTVGVTALPQQTTEQALPNNTVKYTRVTDPDDGSIGWSLPGVVIGCRYPA